MESEVLEPQLTEGEKFIEEYLLDENIKYIAQHKVSLPGDSKSYRIIDFYLPKHDAYIEFFGMWNVSDQERQRYREKKNLFYENKIPCVIIYPENLGIIEHAFHYRLKKELKRCGRTRALKQYLTHDFHQQHSVVLVLFAYFTLLVVGYFYFKQDFGDFLISAWFSSSLLIGYYYIYSLRKFVKDRYKSLN